MHYRQVGDSGLSVSEIALGTWRTYRSRTSDADVRAAILRAYELGVNLFDTANIYQHGAVETLLGSVLRSLPRETYVVCTKVGYPMSARPNDSGLSRKHIIEQCNASLRRLGVDHIDLYVCHRPDPRTPLDETLRALDDLVTHGKILYGGVSSFSAADLSRADALTGTLGLRRLVCNQPQYSLLAREAESEALPTAHRLGLGTIAWAPLAQGVLTGKYAPERPPDAESRAGNPGYATFMNGLMAPGVLEGVQRLAAVAAEAGVTVAQLALAWVLRRREVSSAIVGVSRPRQLDELLRAGEVDFGGGLSDAVESAFTGRTGAPPAASAAPASAAPASAAPPRRP